MKTQTFKAKDVKSAINLVNDETGVISNTVKRAAERTANGYFAIFIALWARF